MAIRHFTTDGYGNLGNQLYYILQSKRLEDESGDGWEFVPMGYSRKCNTARYAADLGIIKNIAPDYYGTMTHIGSGYFQRYGVDFTREQLNRFISETMLKSRYAHKAEGVDYDTTALVVIRNGDYVSQYPKFNYFDREEFFERAFSALPQSITKIHVSSDDVEMSERLWDEMLKEKFSEVRYLPLSIPSYALLRNGFYKTQILTNSTFAYWGAFQAQARYGKDALIIAPKQFSTDEYNDSHNSPDWVQIDCPIVRG